MTEKFLIIEGRTADVASEVDALLSKDAGWRTHGDIFYYMSGEIVIAVQSLVQEVKTKPIPPPIRILAERNEYKRI